VGWGGGREKKWFFSQKRNKFVCRGLEIIGKKLEVSKVGTVSPIAGAIPLYPKGCRPILFSLITIWRPPCLLPMCNATLSSDLFLLLRRNRPSPEWMFPLSAFRSTCHGPAVTKCAGTLKRVMHVSTVAERMVLICTETMNIYEDDGFSYRCGKDGFYHDTEEGRR
jgi:hypothetical protein